ncbi:MAG: exodeoxyribonuclease VII small subunit [Candidatus Scatovivens sp.]
MKEEELEKLNFEELIKKLEDITEKLEKDNLNLDESIELFEDGMKISKKCNEKLEKSEKKISILLNDGKEIKEEDFHTEE